MSASMKPLTLAEFLDWERSQSIRYEFDGIQPVAMTGGSVQHSRIRARLIVAIGKRLKPPCEVFQSDLKVLTAFGTRARYPDVTIACGVQSGTDDTVAPKIVFEVLSPSSVLLDTRVKPVEYQQTSSILVYVTLAANDALGKAMRRSAEWKDETIDKVIELPEVGISIPLSELHDRLH